MIANTRKERELLKVQKRPFGCFVKLPLGMACGYRNSFRAELNKHETAHEAAIRSNSKNNSHYYGVPIDYLKDIRVQLGLEKKVSEESDESNVEWLHDVPYVE